ncbi:hypothetical protein MASR2M78_15750 [Treponema sp.]
MRTYESFLSLIAELDGDALEIERVRAHNQKAWQRIQEGATDVIDWGALGFTIHTLYGVAENYFLRISKFFENNLPQERWHKALVEKMALDISGVRPPLFTTQTEKQEALELLKFRHRVRNLYGEDLDPKKTENIQDIAYNFFSAFPQMHQVFRSKILAIAEALR